MPGDLGCSWAHEDEDAERTPRDASRDYVPYAYASVRYYQGSRVGGPLLAFDIVLSQLVARASSGTKVLNMDGDATAVRCFLEKRVLFRHTKRRCSCWKFVRTWAGTYNADETIWSCVIVLILLWASPGRRVVDMYSSYCRQHVLFLITWLCATPSSACCC